MSESTIPFQGQTAVLDRPVAAGPDLGSDAAGNDRKKLLLIGGLALVVLLGVMGYFLFLSGGGAEDPAPVAKPRTVAPAAPAAPGTQPEAAQPGKKINVKSFGRDPFKALIVEAPAAPTGGTGTSGSSTDPTAGSGTTSGTTDSGVTPPVATTAHTFRVVEVAPDNSSITVNVDGKRYNNLRAGEVFAKYFKVVLVSGTTNAFQYGEEKFNVLGTKKLTIA